MKGLIFNEGKHVHVAAYVGDDRGAKVRLSDPNDVFDGVDFFINEEDLDVLVDLLLRARNALAAEVPELAGCCTP